MQASFNDRVVGDNNNDGSDFRNTRLKKDDYSYSDSEEQLIPELLDKIPQIELDISMKDRKSMFSIGNAAQSTN